VAQEEGLRKLVWHTLKTLYQHRTNYFPIHTDLQKIFKISRGQFSQRRDIVREFSNDVRAESRDLSIASLFYNKKGSVQISQL
jgi:hypothetical protein